MKVVVSYHNFPAILPTLSYRIPPALRFYSAYTSLRALKG
jgi:hypothetical protein